MGIYHAVIGIIEGGVTAFALSLIFHARPDIVTGEAPYGTRKAKDVIIIAGITVALAIGILAPYYASTYPDGLDSTALGPPDEAVAATVGLAVFGVVVVLVINSVAKRLEHRKAADEAAELRQP
jgi:purine-cytosine permease-like protein